ncbi:MAG: Diguanylate cyclase with GAF sensor [Candidatus Magnetoglobus multicellularis str. Araruama]|uniref:Diguanylate cyclase with GAF sensor n=1 Tax=Candidatus Magnetoglobus multicellularis str. Araruama TaxID=890399 RepID=A0A1V1PIG1_9BACT|nr:MAG: Diguanylate cyclase with GAF sensor [Candidatus Magnetoglobus multicellularis str. Araruama]
MLADLKLEIGDKALFESKDQVGQRTETQASSFLLRTEALEGVLGILILLGINYFWFKDNPGFLGIHPHPYWFILIPIAVRYGLFPGLTAGVTAFGVQIYILVYIYKDISLFNALYSHASLFLLVSAGIGFFGEIRRTESLKQKQNFSSLEQKFYSLLTEYNALVKYKDKKNSEIISQEDTFSSLYKAQEKINSLNESEIYPQLIQLLEKYLSVKSAAIYILTDDKTQLKQVARLAVDDNTEANQTDIIEPNSDTMKEILLKGHMLSINDLLTRPKLAPFFDDKIMCAPIRGTRNRTLGIIVIQHIPFKSLTSQSFQMLKSISDRCGASIEKARMYQMTREKMVLDENTGALTYSYLKERFDEEFARARRYGYIMSVLIFEIQSFYGYDLKMQDTILISFKKIIERKLRNIDLLFHGKDRSQFILALPNTPIWGSRTVRSKLIHEMSQVVFKNEEKDTFSLSVIGGVAGMSSTLSIYKDLLEEAYLDLNFQKKLEESYTFACESGETMILLLIEIIDFRTFTNKVQQDIKRIVEPLLSHHINQNICIFVLESAAMYAMFFSNQDNQSIAALGKRIIKEIKAFKIKPYDDKNKDLLVLAGAKSAHPDMNTAEAWKREVLDTMYNSEVMLLFRYKFDDAQQKNSPLTVMVVEIADYQIFSDDKKKDIISSLSLIFQNMLGDLDIMFYDSAPSRHILFLFQIHFYEAIVMRKRILTEIRSFGFKPYTYEDKSLQIEAGIAQLLKPETPPDQLIKKADEDLRFMKHVWYACLDARQKDIPCCMITFKVLDFEKTSPAIRKDLFYFVESIIARYQENEQMVINHRNEPSYLILFPDTTYNAAVVINMSITEELTDFHLKPYRGNEQEMNVTTTVVPYDVKAGLSHYQFIEKAFQGVWTG